MFKELFENETILFKDVIGKGNIIASINLENYYSDFTIINAIKWSKINNLKLKQIKFPKDTNKYNFYKNYFLLSIVNSKVISYFFNKLMRNGLHTLPNNVKKLPIPIILKQQQKPFITLVDKILSTKTQNPKADTTVLENQIDELVFKLYNLTYEEVKVIDKDFWLSKEEYDNLPAIEAEEPQYNNIKNNPEETELSEPKTPKKRGSRGISVDGLEF